MRTINQTLKASDYDFGVGRWILWANSVLDRVDRLRAARRRKIPVRFEATGEFRRAKDGTFECQHTATYEGVIWSTLIGDEGEEVAVTKCGGCNKYYDEVLKEWL